MNLILFKKYPELKNKIKLYNLKLFSGIFVIISLGIHFTSNLKDYMDLDLGDEVDYIAESINNHFHASRVIYPLWYKFLGNFTSDTIDLFYLNQKVLIIALPICLFILLFRLFNNFIGSLLFSCLFLFSNTNIASEFIYNGVLVAVVNNKINNFTLCLICLLSYSIIVFSKKGWNTITLFTISFFILSYCRNEYGLFLIISSTIYVYTYLKRLKNIKKEKIIFIGYWITAVLTFKSLGLSVFATSYSNIHYLMSYSRNYLERKHMTMNMEIDLITPCLHAFGNHKNLFGFFLSNPSEFVVNAIYSFYNMTIINSYRVADIFIPQALIPYKDKGVINYVLSTLILILILIGLYKIYNERFKLKHFVIKTFFFNILLIATTVLSNVLYYFDPRYYIFFVPILMISILYLVNKIKPFKYLMTVFLILLLIESPTAKEYTKNNRYPVVQFINNSTKIIKEYMLKTNKKKINILTNNGKYDILIPGVKTYDYKILNMLTDSNYLQKYNTLDTFDILIVNEIKPKQDYLWFNRVTEYLETNKDSFNCITYKYPTYTGRIYLKKTNLNQIENKTL